MNPIRIALRRRTWASLAVGIGIFAKICVDRVAHLIIPCDGVDRSFAAAKRLALGAMAVKISAGRWHWINFAHGAFAGASNSALARYALPEAAMVLAGSDLERARTLLRVAQNARNRQFARKRWMRTGPRLSRNRRLSLATTSAYLGDAESVAFFTTGLYDLNTKSLKRQFALQERVARILGAPADYPSVYEAARRIGKDKRREAAGTGAHRQRPVQIGMLDGYNPPIPLDAAAETVPVDRDFLLALAAVEGPVWLPVGGSFGQEAYPGHFNSRQAFPFPGNVRPLFLTLHFAEPRILGSLDSTALDWFRRFMPIGCRDLFTARLLRGAGIEAFVGENKLPQTVLEGILKGWGEAEVYAYWREATAPAMARTDALVAERDAKYSLPEVRLEDLELGNIPVRVFGPAGSPDENAVHLAFAFDENIAEVFPGTFEGIWRHATRPLVVHIFGRGLTAAMFEQWVAQFVCNGDSAKACPSVRFIWLDLSGLAFGDVHLIPYATVSTMDRLLAPALLPDVEKVVYLDVDILVRKDISGLFDTDLGDSPLAGRNDPLPRFRIGARRVYEFDHDNRLTKEQREVYRNAFFSGATVFEGFNAGVLVMNLTAMRRNRIVEKALSLVQACGVDDQVALNLTVRRRRSPLADEWNTFPDDELWEDPALVHFIGHIKPWVQSLFISFWNRRFREWSIGDERGVSQTRRNEWLENARCVRKRLKR